MPKEHTRIYLDNTKAQSQCGHGKLTAIDNYSSVDVQGWKESPDYFMYKRYKCEDCGGTVIVLHAVVEKLKETKNGL